MRNLAHILIAGLLLAGPAAAREIYVSNTAGDDRFAGRRSQTSPDGTGPVRTISRALRLAHSGDRIMLEATGQPYHESISLVGSRHSGYSQQPFEIVGNGAVLDGSAPVPVDQWEHVEGAVFRFQPRRLGPQQLFLDGRPAQRVPVERMAAAPPKLEPLEWCSYSGSIYFCVQQDKIPRDYDLTYTSRTTGITLYHVSEVNISGLIVQGFQVDGISAHNSARDVTLSDVTCRGNGRAGVSVGGASTVVIRNSTLGDNGQAQLLTLPYSETKVVGSELLTGLAPAWVDHGGELFVDGKSIENPDALEAVQPEEDAKE